MDYIIELHCLLVIGQIVFIASHGKLHQSIVSKLKLGSDDIVLLGHIYCEANQGGRHVNLVEGAAHAILSADGRKAKLHLCIVCAEQGCERLTPALGICAHAAEILLEGEANLLIITA